MLVRDWARERRLRSDRRNLLRGVATVAGGGLPYLEVIGNLYALEFFKFFLFKDLYIHSEL